MIMSNVVLKKDVQKAEELLFSQGVDVYSLIERAGASLCREVGDVEGVTVVVGSGKNGADGVSAGLCLADKGISVRIFVVGDKRCTETQNLLRVAEQSGIEIREYYDGMQFYDEVVLDCLFGIGLSRKVDGVYMSAISAINSSGAKIISADIPSGLDSDSGRVLGACVKADVTVSFSGKKAGYYLNDGKDYTGEIVYADTGINPIGNITLLEECTFPKRKNNTHKGDWGKVYILAGSPKYVGASLLAEMSARACLRSGAGLCTLCVPLSMRDVYAKRVLESTLLFVPDCDGNMIFDKTVLNQIIEKADVVAIGPGLGVSDDIKNIVSYVVQNFGRTVLLDADALNSISCEPDILKGGTDVVITPHLGEFARLTKKAIKDIDYLTDTVNFAKEFGVTVHLKGSGNVTATKDGKITLTASGTPAMAKGGSGDVLTGIASAFFAMNIDNAMEKASLVHGMAGQMAEKKFGAYGTLARDIADCIPEIMRERIS